MAATGHAAVVGVFESRDQAERAVADLRKAGFADAHIGLVGRDASGATTRADGAGKTSAGEGAAIGAAAGAGVGGLVGLGIMAGVIPVIGPVLALGTLGTILLNAAGGAAIAGIAGALVGSGIPEEDAHYYEGEVKAGRFLVTVQADGRADDARRIVQGAGGYDRASAATRVTTTPATGGTAAGGRTVELKEEHLKVSKTPVRVGEVEVRKEVVTEHRQITVPVEREEVVIERHPASGRAAPGTIRPEEIRIPVKEEQVHVTKEAVVKEEVTVGKRTVHDTRTVEGEVKKEELRVEAEGRANVRQTGGPDKK
jgi:uncharacterized protein (TIGR02271 family)